MKRVIQVFVGDGTIPIGIIRYNSQGARENASFEYSTEWLNHPGRFSIGPDLPLIAGPQFHKRERDGSVFHNPIADTEPDGWGRRVILRAHQKQRQKLGNEPPLNELDFLLAVDDFSRAGALRFQDEKKLFQKTSIKGERKAPQFIELSRLLSASRAVETHHETEADLAYLQGRGTSLGGIRPKCTVLDEEGILSIGKFPSIADERAVTKGEVLALQLATTAGINAAHARIVYSDKIPIALIRRFDRLPKGKRILYTSAATMLGASHTDSIQHTYTDIVDSIRINSGAVQEDIDELWKRIAFSILITNIDDHLLNHGFLHTEGSLWRLAPAFDINPFPERVRELKTWISEKSGPEASIEALMESAPYFRIPLKRAKDILAHVESAISSWREVGKQLGMTKNELDQFQPAFEHHERLAVQRLVAPKG
jgi:serine/threonine-protein kinase HipA